MTRLLLEILGNIIFEVGRFVGGLKFKLGIIRPIPKRYRSANQEQHEEEARS